MKAVKRIVPERCCAVVVDFQGFFLAQLPPRERARIKANAVNLVRLLNAYGIPVTVTLERPVAGKGNLPKEIVKVLGEGARTFEKDFFDLTKDTKIKGHLARLKRRQIIVAGCETDVCVMQSCFGLIALGYEVYVVEELVFSSARNVKAALARMQSAGCTFVTYKMLFYELLESVEGPAPRSEAFGSFPDDLPDAAV